MPHCWKMITCIRIKHLHTCTSCDEDWSKADGWDSHHIWTTSGKHIFFSFQVPSELAGAGLSLLLWHLFQQTSGKCDNCLTLDDMCCHFVLFMVCSMQKWCHQTFCAQRKKKRKWKNKNVIWWNVRNSPCFDEMKRKITVIAPFSGRHLVWSASCVIFLALTRNDVKPWA